MTKQGKRAVFSKATGGKYKNKKTTINGIVFDSKKEAQRYLQLRELEKKGKISELQLQVKFKLLDSQYFETLGKKELGVSYIADFAYKDGLGRLVVEDVKSKITKKKSDYRIKRKLMKYFHNIEILEIE